MINLVEKLRYTPGKGLSVWGDLQARADAIKALTAERDTLRQKLAEAAAQIEVCRKQEPVGYVPALGIEMMQEKGGWCRCNGVPSSLHVLPLYAAPVVADDVQRDAERYAKLRWCMPSNVPEGRSIVEQLGAVAAWQGWSSMDAYLDSMEVCSVGLRSKAMKGSAA
jgi:hypothetical protein